MSGNEPTAFSFDSPGGEEPGGPEHLEQQNLGAGVEKSGDVSLGEGLPSDTGHPVKKSNKKKLLIAIGGAIAFVVVGSVVLSMFGANQDQARRAAAAKERADAEREMKLQEEDTKKKSAEDAARRKAEQDAQAASQVAATEAQFDEIKVENADLKAKLADALEKLSKKPKVKVKIVEKVKVVEKPVEKVVEKPVPAPEPKVDLPRSHCEFKGSLVNRAWLICDGKLMSVVAGDPLPYPYAEVTKVNDGQSSGGSVVTKGGGVIE